MMMMMGAGSVIQTLSHRRLSSDLEGGFLSHLASVNESLRL